MRARFFAISLIAAALLGQRGMAAEQYTFAPVPPPSIFSTNLPPALREVFPGALNPASNSLPATVTNAVLAPPSPATVVVPKKSRGKPRFEPVPEPPVPAKAPAAPPENLPAVPVGSVAVTNLIITAGSQYSGMVMAVDPEMRFVVLNYALGWLPGPGQELTVYRHGLRVGTVKVSGPRRDDNVTADITDGELKAGDEARIN